MSKYYDFYFVEIIDALYYALDLVKDKANADYSEAICPTTDQTELPLSEKVMLTLVSYIHKKETEKGINT